MLNIEVIVLYERIRGLREDRDLTQKDLGELLGVSQATYSRYESGKLDIPTDVLLRLADYYHVTVDYLLGRGEETRP